MQTAADGKKYRLTDRELALLLPKDGFHVILWRRDELKVKRLL